MSVPFPEVIGLVISIGTAWSPAESWLATLRLTLRPVDSAFVLVGVTRVITCIGGSN